MFSCARTFWLCLMAVTLLSHPPMLAQTALPQRPHVERFSTPEVRAERSEADATAKLAANSNDTEALNARALARMRLGRYSEAYEDLHRATALKPSNADY